MSKPLGISELVARAGDENIQVQNPLHNTTSLFNGKRQATITFVTDPKMVQEFMRVSGTDTKASHVGLVLWIPTEIIDRINTDNPLAPTGDVCPECGVALYSPDGKLPDHWPDKSHKTNAPKCPGSGRPESTLTAIREIIRKEKS